MVYESDAHYYSHCIPFLQIYRFKHVLDLICSVISRPTERIVHFIIFLLSLDSILLNEGCIKTRYESIVATYILLFVYLRLNLLTLYKPLVLQLMRCTG